MTSYGRMLVRFIHSMFPVSGITQGCCVWFHFWHAVAQYLSITFYKRFGCSTWAIGTQVLDWEGGIGIVIALKEPKMLWARLVFLLSSVVLLITDGLEREVITQLQAEIARLALRAREFICLDPLLLWDQFLPQAAGICTMLPYYRSSSPTII